MPKPAVHVDGAQLSSRCLYVSDGGHLGYESTTRAVHATDIAGIIPKADAHEPEMARTPPILGAIRQEISDRRRSRTPSMTATRTE
jgi:hypothetical protein